MTIAPQTILSTAYLPPISFFAVCCQQPVVAMEAHENYLKQSYRNRCNIADANGRISLNIPIEKQEKDKILIKEVLISNHENWQQKHWKTIKSAYNSSPFFMYYEDDFEIFYHKKWKYLWDYNWELMQKIVTLLDIDCQIEETNDYVSAPKNEDFRAIIHPKKKTIIETQIPYYQVFVEKNGFFPDLSIIDLLFNMGNESRLILNKLTLKNN